MQKMIIRRSKHMLTEFGLPIQVSLCIGCFGLPSLLIPRGLVGHHLSSRGGISEMFHSCRRPSRQLPLRLRWSLYWRRGGAPQPFSPFKASAVAHASLLDHLLVNVRVMAAPWLNSPKWLTFNVIFNISQLALTLASKSLQIFTLYSRLNHKMNLMSLL